MSEYTPTPSSAQQLGEAIAQQALQRMAGTATATPRATSTPKPTSTPNARDRVSQLKGPDGKLHWYVIDLTTGQPISPPYDTVESAKHAATYTYPLTTPTPGAFAAPTSTPTPQPPPAGVSNPGMYSQEMLAALDVNTNYTGPPGYGASGGGSQVGPAGRTAAQVAGTAYLSDAEAEWYRALPTSVKAAVEGGRSGGTSSTGTAGGSSAKPSAVPPEIQTLMDSFEGFSDKDVVNAYYAGEITRDQLAMLITARNTSEKGVPKYTTASLDRYLTQVDAEKPQPKRTMLDVLGERFGNIGRSFNIKDPQFGGQGAFSSSTAGSGTDKNLYTAQSGGQGVIPVSSPGGNMGLAGAVVDNQLYPNRGATVQDAGMMEGRLNYSGSPASILAQSGVYVGDSSFATQMQALGNLIALREFFMEQNPSLSHSQANELAAGTMQPANRKQDPSASGLASFSDAPPDYSFAKGGRKLLQEPTVGIGLYSREPQFMAAEGGKKEWVEPTRNGLEFTPTDKDISMGRDNMFMDRLGRSQKPKGSMLALMRLMGVPMFAEGGVWDPWEDMMKGSETFGSGGWSYPKYPVSYVDPYANEGELNSGTFLKSAQSAMQAAHTDQRQDELNAYKAALNDTAGIANIGRLQRQRDAYDPRFAMAGMRLPTEVQAPLTGPMSALPPGVRYALETPASRQSQLSGLNDQQRALDLARLQALPPEKQLQLDQAVKNRDVNTIAQLLGLTPELVQQIFTGSGGMTLPPGGQVPQPTLPPGGQIPQPGGGGSSLWDILGLGGVGGGL